MQFKTKAFSVIFETEMLLKKAIHLYKHHHNLEKETAEFILVSSPDLSTNLVSLSADHFLTIPEEGIKKARDDIVSISPIGFRLLEAQLEQLNMRGGGSTKYFAFLVHTHHSPALSSTDLKTLSELQTNLTALVDTSAEATARWNHDTLFNIFKIFYIDDKNQTHQLVPTIEGKHTIFSLG